MGYSHSGKELLAAYYWMMMWNRGDLDTCKAIYIYQGLPCTAPLIKWDFIPWCFYPVLINNRDIVLVFFFWCGWSIFLTLLINFTFQPVVFIQYIFMWGFVYCRIKLFMFLHFKERLSGSDNTVSSHGRAASSWVLCVSGKRKQYSWLMTFQTRKKKKPYKWNTSHVLRLHCITVLYEWKPLLV